MSVGDDVASDMRFAPEAASDEAILLLDHTVVGEDSVSSMMLDPLSEAMTEAILSLDHMVDGEGDAVSSSLYGV